VRICNFNKAVAVYVNVIRAERLMYTSKIIEMLKTNSTTIKNAEYLTLAKPLSTSSAISYIVIKCMKRIFANDMVFIRTCACSCLEYDVVINYGEYIRMSMCFFMFDLFLEYT
jgi:hypothetical protein